LCINTQVVSEEKESESGNMLFGEGVKMVAAAPPLSSRASTLRESQKKMRVKVGICCLRRQ
jgi:hypothetical protein